MVIQAKWYRLTICAALILLAGGVLPESAQAQKGPGLEKVIMAIPATDAGFLPLLMARHKGFFKEEGMEVPIPVMSSDIAMKALQTKDIDFSAAAGSVARAAAVGVPLKVVLYTTRRPAFFLLARPGIASVAEMKGRTVGVHDIAGSTNYATRLVLEAKRLDPDRDVKIMVTGPGTSTLAALKAGSVDAAILYPPFNIMATQAGFREIAYVGDVVQFPMNGYGTTDKKIKENPQQVKRVIRALLRGVGHVMDNRSESIDLLIKDWQLSRELATGAYEAIIRGFTRSGDVSEESIKAEIGLVAKRLQMTKEIPVTQVVNFTLLKEVQKELNLR